MFNYFLYFIIITIGTAGQLLLKYGVNRSSAKIGSIDSVATAFQAALVFLGNPWIILALASYAFGALLYLMLLFKADLSLVFPSLAIGYLTVLLFSGLLLHEQISVQRVIGTLIIALGVAITLLSKQ